MTDIAVLGDAHARVAAVQPRPSFDGCCLTVAELAVGPDDCPDVPCSQSGRFAPAGRFGINPVTFCELARRRETLAYLDATIDSALAL